MTLSASDKWGRVPQHDLAVRPISKWRTAGLVGLCAAGMFGAGLMGFVGGRLGAAGTRAEVRARKFVLVDQDGKARACLNVAGLSLSDEKGTIRAYLSMDNDAAGLALADDKGTIRAGLAVHKDGAGLAVNDDRGEVRAGLSVEKDQARLDLLDGNGTKRAGLFLDKETGAAVVLSDEKGRIRAGLGVDKDGTALSWP